VTKISIDPIKATPILKCGSTKAATSITRVGHDPNVVIVVAQEPIGTTVKCHSTSIAEILTRA
jgi:hypothetical protein